MGWCWRHYTVRTYALSIADWSHTSPFRTGWLYMCQKSRDTPGARSCSYASGMRSRQWALLCPARKIAAAMTGRAYAPCWAARQSGKGGISRCLRAGIVAADSFLRVERPPAATRGAGRATAIPSDAFHARLR